MNVRPATMFFKHLCKDLKEKQHRRGLRPRPMGRGAPRGSLRAPWLAVFSSNCLGWKAHPYPAECACRAQGNPKDKIYLAVEPVEIILISFLKNELHKFFKPFLLYTEIKANFSFIINYVLVIDQNCVCFEISE